MFTKRSCLKAGACTTLGLGLCLLGLGTGTAQAQSPTPGTYPQQPIKLLLSVAPGGALDFVARTLQAKLGEALGQPVMVENKVGASGNIGMAAAAKSAPDGYTLFLGSAGLIAINPAVFNNLQVHPASDFQAITLVAESPSVLVASPSYPPSTLKEFIADAKARPGQLFYASPGSGSQNRLEMEMLRQAEQIELTHVPYKGGAGEASVAVVSGQPQVLMTSLPSAIGLIKAGRLKPYALTSASRNEQLPQVPTMVELGYSGFVTSAWQGLFVPRGTPKEIVDKLFGAMQRTLKNPEVVERLAKGGVGVVTSPSVQSFQDLVVADTLRWAKVAKAAGATAD